MSFGIVDASWPQTLRFPFATLMAKQVNLTLLHVVSMRFVVVCTRGAICDCDFSSSARVHSFKLEFGDKGLVRMHLSVGQNQKEERSIEEKVELFWSENMLSIVLN